MEQVVGRDVDIIYSPSGKLIDGAFFINLLYGIQGVAKFQVVQETRNHLDITFVPDGKSPIDLERLRREILRLGDPDFEIDFRLVDEITPLPSGKYAFTASKVGLPF